ncbi:hypothetical protein CAPTEDRAFT_186494 [Capitella teleta]|uniref:Uncharacterized protein n=1 Tax=Capitella teleta TaxID=283909 RepID=R7V1U1_CAPTE|nr:hypothetical protein CAPTEDRAFT_186494 [Capitella teleta]|eukprot:ELU12813.1 hypothetical protein CAPTEDRAFT_186494 [Capitella teleta]
MGGSSERAIGTVRKVLFGVLHETGFSLDLYESTIKERYQKTSSSATTMQKATRLQLGSVNMKIDGPMSHTQKFNMAMTISSKLADVVADCGQATFQTRMTFLARVLAMFKLGRSEEENEQRHQVSLGEADDEAVPEQMLIGESEVRHEVMSEDVVESSGNALRCQVVSQDGVLVGDVVLESGVIDDADDVDVVGDDLGDVESHLM